MSGELSRTKRRAHLERDPGHAAEHALGPTIRVSRLGHWSCDWDSQESGAEDSNSGLWFDIWGFWGWVIRIKGYGVLQTKH